MTAGVALSGLSILALCAAGCGADTSSLGGVNQGQGRYTPPLSSSCGVTDDQRHSFMAPVDALPIQVKVDAAFSALETAAIRRAVDEWNANAPGGALFFRAVEGAVPAGDLRTADPRGCLADEGGPEEVNLLRETGLQHWSVMNLGRNITGVTVRCMRRRSSQLRLVRQVTYLNLSLMDSSQLQSVALHELGHALGLDHSCADLDGDPGFVGCAGLPPEHAYRAAVMYPSLRAADGFSPPETKETLQPNDLLRAFCLYP